MNLTKNNNIVITGEISSDFEFSHSVAGEDFYIFTLRSVRMSGNPDMIQVITSDRIFDVARNLKGLFVSISGELRSHDYDDETGNHLKVFVFAKEIEFIEEFQCTNKKYDKNSISMKGYICKPPIYRKTPMGREIADLLLAVNRPYGKSDYIPCICWGRNALYASSFDVGTKVSVSGRVQSRIYNKWTSENEFEERTTYEVSVQSLEVCAE